MKIKDGETEYPNEIVAVFTQLKRIADALERVASVKEKELAR